MHSLLIDAFAIFAIFVPPALAMMYYGFARQEPLTEEDAAEKKAAGLQLEVSSRR